MRETRTLLRLTALLLIGTIASAAAAGAGEEWTIVGWNNLGMHCMDADYSLFSLLPPFNTFHAQVIDPTGQLVVDPSGIVVTYEAVADPDGSINRTSAGKSNFWDFVEELFGAGVAVDQGLAGNAMPGALNQPQPMTFDAAAGWFSATGVPITPYDDSGARNTYPLMRLTARDAQGRLLATTDIVLPVSDEMSCVACHASGASPAAQPFDGWANDPDPERDFRLNVLLLHDDRVAFREEFKVAAAAAGYDPRGLVATAVDASVPVLCARCHASEALPGSGLAGITPLTQAIHRRMAFAQDPTNGLPLDAVDNRSACYRCHPGSETRCLRGAMGSAVAADGTLAMQCQSCHGRMTDVASPDRVGWLDEPRCQSCHTGTATNNGGAIRYVSVFTDDGAVREAADTRFATSPDTPAAGLSLYRFSRGHGGLYCSACHGSTHAELPSSEHNDNLQSEQVQGHQGVLAECNACHATADLGADGGPHGLHPLGQAWVERHGDVAEHSGAAACRACHGADERGTVLSRAQADRVLQTDLGPKHFWRGFEIGCYTCHLGSGDDDANPNRAPVVNDESISVARDVSPSIPLSANDSDGDSLVLRIVTQPAHGTVALNDAVAKYFPEADYSGEDVFTFAARDGDTDSNLGTIALSVGAFCGGDCDGDGHVFVDEIVSGVSIALGAVDLAQCRHSDTDADGRVTVDELIRGVTAALEGCP
jgi:hypothetical protein